MPHVQVAVIRIYQGAFCAKLGSVKNLFSHKIGILQQLGLGNPILLYILSFNLLLAYKGKEFGGNTRVYTIRIWFPDFSSTRKIKTEPLTKKQVIHTHIYTNTYVHMYICTYTHIYIYTDTHTYLQIKQQWHQCEKCGFTNSLDATECGNCQASLVL